MHERHRLQWRLTEKNSGSYLLEFPSPMCLCLLVLIFSHVTNLEPAKTNRPQKNPVPSTAYPVTGSGDGRFPTHDPWGKEFTKNYNKDRWKLGGQKIAGPFKGCLEGIQGDQDYVRAMMTPARFWANNSSISYNFLVFFRSTNGA